MRETTATARKSAYVPGEDLSGSPVLLHICCAPCATYPVQRLRELGYVLTGYWFNPNVHPWLEHEARRKSLIHYAAKVGLPVQWEPGYHILGFLRQVAGAEERPHRCLVCYAMRLSRAAAAARRLGIPCFTTTLLVSPYQDQDLIREAGERAAREQDVEFYFENFRRGWSERSRLTRHFDLYRQQYCGCVFSEFERYTGTSIAAASEIHLEDR